MSEYKIKTFLFDPLLFFCILALTIISIFTLNALAPFLFPEYYFFVIIGFLLFFVFSKVDFEVLLGFSGIFYAISIILLFIPLIMGQVTRGTIRWIQIGSISIQPSEIVRPFLILFSSFLLAQSISTKKIWWVVFLHIFPIALIIIQPSLGVSILTGLGFAGTLIASKINKKKLFYVFLVFLILIPVGFTFLAQYQKERILTFINPYSDPFGAGYNSIQAMISVGAGGVFGRGLGKGVQTQLKFLPEKQTDFVFASISEELGMIGSFLVLFLFFFLYNRLITFISKAKMIERKMFVSGVFLVLFSETMIHIGMNLGLLPITGIPLPLISAGGSSFVATMISLGMVLSSSKV